MTGADTPPRFPWCDTATESYRKCEAKTHGFSRGMKPTTGNQTTLQWQTNSPMFKNHKLSI